MTRFSSVVTSTAWWAPLAVLLLHKLVMVLGLRAQTDWLLHFTGGLAITFFIWSIVPFLAEWLGSISMQWRFLIALLGGCSVALLWDLAEFGSDELLHTHIQHSLKETMLDLTCGLAGATTAAAALILFCIRRSNTKHDCNCPNEELRKSEERLQSPVL